MSDVFQTAAAGKYLCFHRIYSRRPNHTAQRRAAFKCSRANPGYAVRDKESGQAFIAVKCSPGNDAYLLREMNFTDKIPAVPETSPVRFLSFQKTCDPEILGVSDILGVKLPLGP